MKIITNGYIVKGVGNIFFFIFFLFFTCYLKTFFTCYLKVCITFIIRKRCYSSKKLKYDGGIAYMYRVKIKINCSETMEHKTKKADGNKYRITAIAKTEALRCYSQN